MRAFLLLLLWLGPLNAQILQGIFADTPVAGGGGAFGTPAGSACDNAGAGACVTGAHTTTAGDALIFYAGMASGSGCSTVLTLQLPTDTGSDTFIAIPPTASNAEPVIGIQITAGGSGYTAPTCSLSGSGAGGGACSVSLSGGVVASVSVAAQGSYTGPVTVTLGGSTGSGATAVVAGYGQSAASFCTVGWYAKNIAGTTNNQITVPTEISGLSFNSGVAAEITGASTSSPLDTSTGGVATSGASITTPTFSTANANEVVFCATRVENLSDSWTAGNIGGVASAFVTGATGAGSNNFQNIEYKAFSSTQSSITGAVSSSPNADRSILCVALTQ